MEVQVHQEVKSDDIDSYNLEMQISDVTADAFAATLLYLYQTYNFDFALGRSDHFMKDAALICESIRSIVRKYHGHEHCLQKLSEDLFTIQTPEAVSLHDPSRPE